MSDSTQDKDVEYANASIQEGVDLEASLKAAAESGMLRQSVVRAPVKMKSDAAKIVIAVPIGDKDDPDMYQCPHCGTRQIPETVPCSKCGGAIDSGYKLRTSGLVPIEFLMAMWQTVPPLLVNMTIMVRKGILSAQAREEMTMAAFDGEAKYIFYVDDDVIIPQKALYEMHGYMERNPHIGALTGVYTTRESSPEPLVYKNHGEGAYWNFSTEHDVSEPVMAAGAGCLLARVECLREVKGILGGPLWADIHEFERGGGRTMWGHDIRFCRRIWEAGEDPKASRKWEVHVAGWVQCFHFDCREQMLYGMPHDSPCFTNKNTPGYWDKMYRMGQEDAIRQSKAYLELYKEVAEHIPRYSDVIDVGSGPGLLLEILARLKQVRGKGVDMSPLAVEQLQERFFEAELNRAGDWAYGRINGGEKDPIVVSTQSMEHLPAEEMDRFLSEAAKAPRTILSVPEGELEGTPPGEHLQVFTEESLTEILKPKFKSVTIKKVRRDDENNFLVAICDRGET